MFNFNRNQYTRIHASETRWERQQRMAREREFWNSPKGKTALLMMAMAILWFLMGLLQVASRL